MANGPLIIDLLHPVDAVLQFPTIGRVQDQGVEVPLWIKEDSKPYDLTGYTLGFYGRDAKGVAKIAVQDATGPAIQAGRVTYTMPGALFRAAGQYQEAWFRIEKEGQLVSSLNVRFNVLENNVEFGLDDEPYYSEYEELIKNLKQQSNDDMEDLSEKVKKFLNHITVLDDETIAQISTLSQSVGAIQDQINAGNVITIKQFNDETKLLQDMINSQVQNAFSKIGDGSPKGTYADLAALEKALPNGAVGIYLTASDNHWHYYSGGEWKDGGSYTPIVDQKMVQDASFDYGNLIKGGTFINGLGGPKFKGNYLTGKAKSAVSVHLFGGKAISIRTDADDKTNWGGVNFVIDANDIRYVESMPFVLDLYTQSAEAAVVAVSLELFDDNNTAIEDTRQIIGYLPIAGGYRVERLQKSFFYNKNDAVKTAKFAILKLDLRPEDNATSWDIWNPIFRQQLTPSGGSLENHDRISNNFVEKNTDSAFLTTADVRGLTYWESVDKTDAKYKGVKIQVPLSKNRNQYLTWGIIEAKYSAQFDNSAQVLHNLQGFDAANKKVFDVVNAGYTPEINRLTSHDIKISVPDIKDLSKLVLTIYQSGTAPQTMMISPIDIRVRPYDNQSSNSSSFGKDWMANVRPNNTDSNISTDTVYGQSRIYVNNETESKFTGIQLRTNADRYIVDRALEVKFDYLIFNQPTSLDLVLQYFDRSEKQIGQNVLLNIEKSGTVMNGHIDETFKLSGKGIPDLNQITSVKLLLYCPDSQPVAFEVYGLESHIISKNNRNVLPMLFHSAVNLPTQVTINQLDAKIKGISHRGLNTVAPEESKSAYLFAKENGYLHWEGDINWTKDNVPMMIHDLSINRTARNLDGSELSLNVNLTDINYSDLSKFDFGIVKGKSFKGEPLLTFEELVKLARYNDVFLHIEFKYAFTQEQVQALHNIVVKYNMLDRIGWQAFVWDWLKPMMALEPNGQYELLGGTVNDDYFAKLDALKTSNNTIIASQDASISIEDATKISDHGIPIYLWIVGSGEIVRKFRDIGMVEGIMTNGEINVADELIK